LDGHLLLPQEQKPLGYSEKPINEIQSLSRKPVNNDAKAKQYFPIKPLYRKYNSDGEVLSRRNLALSMMV